MSTTRNANGRPPTTPATQRGRKILAAIRGRGMTMRQAATEAGVAFQSLYAAIHGPPERLTVRTVVGLCRLGIPLALVAPSIAELHQTSAT